MAVVFIPLEGCQATAAAVQTAMALSVAHLFDNTLPAPDPSTPIADYTSAEANFTGYVSKTLTAWNAPILSEGSGYMIQSPLVQFQVDPAPSVTDVISGAYVLDAGGVNRLVVIFTEPIPMQLAGQGIPISFTMFFPTGV